MNHIAKIASNLSKNGLDGIYLSCEANRLYASGFASSGNDGAILITNNESYYITDFRYTEAATRIINNAEILTVDTYHSYIYWVNALCDKHKIKRIGFDDRYVTVSQFSQYHSSVSAEFVPSSDFMSTMRCQKDDEELQLMVEAQKIAQKALIETKNIIREGITEKEIAANLLYNMLLLGAEDKSFDPIVVSGKNTSLPHGVPSEKKLEQGDFITIDFGCKYKGYCSDTTRTFALGYATDEMRIVYDTVLQAQLNGIQNLKSGITGKEADANARSIIEKAGYGSCFGHSFGHGLGVEIHESPNLSPSNENVLLGNSVVSAEPGIYIPDKFGVRIEDVVILKDNCCIDITDLPKELEIL